MHLDQFSCCTSIYLTLVFIIPINPHMFPVHDASSFLELKALGFLSNKFMLVRNWMNW